MTEHHLPSDIERSSFAIICRELDHMGIRLPAEQADVILRCIHATADFDYVRTLQFSDGAVEAALAALQSGCAIVTDTNMALSGLSSVAMQKLGVKAHCFMSEPETAERALRLRCTRASASMDLAAEAFPQAVRAVGNAPTALLRLSEQMEAGLRPALIVAVPVGFVNVVESKEQILAACVRYGVPCIAAMGRKGGSTVAAAICNALLYRAAAMTAPEARGWS